MSVKAIDNATTCEQYVVAKLKSDEAMIKRMNETVMELNCEIKKLEAERDSEIATFIRKTGRNQIVRSSRSWSTNGESVVSDGKIKNFENWAKGYVDKYPAPKFMTQDELICEFTPELSEIYTDLVAEAKEEDE